MREHLVLVVLAGLLLLAPNQTTAEGAIAHHDTYHVTGDYVAAGVGLFGQTSGEIRIRDLPAKAEIEEAFLYWGYMTIGEPAVDLSTITFQSLPVTGELVGQAGDICWWNDTGNFDRTYAYRARVGKQIYGNGVYNIEGVYSNNKILAEGASLVVVYQTDRAGPRSIVIWDGNASNNSCTFTDYQIDGFTASADADARTTFIVGGGQKIEGAALWDAAVLATPGSTVPLTFVDAFDGADGTHWDTFTEWFFPELAEDDTSVGVAIDATGPSEYYCDCLMWVAQVVSVGTACRNAPQGTILFTVGKGQSPTNNQKVAHTFYGKSPVVATKPNATEIPLCEGAPVTFEIDDTSGDLPRILFDTTVFDPETHCTDMGGADIRCNVDALENEITYTVTSTDGKDKDRITLVPVP